MAKKPKVETENVKTLHPSFIESLKYVAETQFVDVKAKEIAPAKLSRSISAFCNTDGGVLIVGIEEKKDIRTWSGFANEEAANGIFQLIHEVFPLHEPINAAFYRAQGEKGLVLILEMAKTAQIVKATDGKAYIRRGASNQPITNQEQLKQLELTKGVSSHEDSTVRDEVENIRTSKTYGSFIEAMVPNADKDVWLKKQRLEVNGLPTVAAELLFSDEPQIVLPKSAIKIYRYKTTDREGTRDTLEFQPLTIEGCAYDLIAKSVSETVKITESIPIMGKEGLEKISYPTEAIHEVITNAVIHRDYSINDDIHIRIFDNRIEVLSPGKLPAYITPKNILEERFARNPKIVRLLNKFPNPPNKDVGEGMNTTFEAMRKLDLQDPIVTQTENSVLVILRHERLASLEDRIMAHLRRAPHLPINNAEAREICNEVSDSKVRKAFQRMLGAKMIEKVPGTRGKGTRYRMKLPKQASSE
ncbi:ATP-binding protein [Pseudolabrys sp.]|uniref:ATP-binding protein n=1 Tax=Pseudolabrys sp. TaxID=1960880 RepID=UPI003D0B2596